MKMDEADHTYPVRSSVMSNPFVHRLEFSIYERIKFAVMSLTAAPIRVIALLLTLSCAWVVAVGGLIGHDKEAYKKPLSKWHRDYLKPILCQLLRLLFVIGGWHWIPVKGKKASSKEAPILVIAPHSSFFDALVVSFIGAPSIVAKADISLTPFFGAITKYCEPIYVKRDDPNSRQNTIQEITKRSSGDNEWCHNQVAIFPEGTCTNRTCLISFKPGAFVPGAPVQPVCLKYKNKNDVVTWTYDGPSALKLIWTSLCQFNNNLELEFLPVYYPNEQEKNDPVIYANNVRKLMAKCLDLPLVNCTYGDHKIILKTMRDVFPIESDLHSIQKLRKNLNLPAPRAELSNYLEFTKRRNDPVTLEKFGEYLQSSSSSDDIKNLFDKYEKQNNENDDEVIDFRDYALDLCLLSGSAVELEPPVKLAFKVLDRTGKLELEYKQFEKLLIRSFDLTTDDCEKIYKSINDKKDVEDKPATISYESFSSFCERKSFFNKLFIGFGDIETESTNHDSTNESPSKMKSE